MRTRHSNCYNFCLSCCGNSLESTSVLHGASECDHMVDHYVEIPKIKAVRIVLLEIWFCAAQSLAKLKRGPAAWLNLHQK